MPALIAMLGLRKSVNPIGTLSLERGISGKRLRCLVGVKMRRNPPFAALTLLESKIPLTDSLRAPTCVDFDQIGGCLFDARRSSGFTTGCGPMLRRGCPDWRRLTSCPHKLDNACECREPTLGNRGEWSEKRCWVLRFHPEWGRGRWHGRRLRRVLRGALLRPHT
jgi:hypothetical protein